MAGYNQIKQQPNGGNQQQQQNCYNPLPNNGNQAGIPLENERQKIGNMDQLNQNNLKVQQQTATSNAQPLNANIMGENGQNQQLQQAHQVFQQQNGAGGQQFMPVQNSMLTGEQRRLEENDPQNANAAQKFQFDFFDKKRNLKRQAKGLGDIHGTNNSNPKDATKRPKIQMNPLPTG